MSILAVRDVTKTYRVTQKDPGLRGAFKALFKPNVSEKVAINKLSFQIDAPEIVGYIGVNGAGKSTTIKLLTGILHPTSGDIQVLGRNPQQQRSANAREIGAVFGQRTQLWWDLAFRESLDLIGHIYELEPQCYRERLTEFRKILDLDELLAMPIRTMSLGQKMRAELAAAFIHDPKVVYLDEPTIGLDIMVKERIRDFVREHHRRFETTVMLTTHDLADIEQLCRRVIIIDNGAKIYDGSLAAIKDRFGAFRTITFDTSKPFEHIRLPEGVEEVAREELRYTIRFDRRRISASQVVSHVMPQLEVIDFTLSEADLENVIKHLYAGTHREMLREEVLA